MCTVLGVARSTYYKSFDKTKSAREVENEELKAAIINKKVAEGLENVLKRDFTTTSINEKWVGDITYIHTIKDGWCYLASVLDLHSKKIIGYAFGKRMTNTLVVKALKNAYYSQNLDKNKSLIFHTDLGSQYTSNELKNLCKEFNIIQ